MSANVYSITDLLIGKNYRSKSIEGEIISAEIHPKAVWYDGCDSYLVEVRPNYSTTSGLSKWYGKTEYRTLAVKVGE